MIAFSESRALFFGAGIDSCCQKSGYLRITRSTKRGFKESGMTNTPQSEALEKIANWGRQTILFAMSLHAISKGKPLNDRDRAMAAGSETYRIAEELWAGAHAECEQPAELSGITMLFSRKVLDWAAEHRKDDTT